MQPIVALKPGILLVILKHLGCYLLGVFTCVIFTPVEPVLAGKVLWPVYPLLAVVGCFLYFTLSPAYTFGNDVAHWLVCLLGLAFVMVGVAVHFGTMRRLRFLSPMLFSFPIGFVGTLGVYYAAAQSI